MKIVTMGQFITLYRSGTYIWQCTNCEALYADEYRCPNCESRSREVFLSYDGRKVASKLVDLHQTTLRNALTSGPNYVLEQEMKELS